MQLPTSSQFASSMSALPRGGIIRYAVVAFVVILVIGWIKFTPSLPSIPNYVPGVKSGNTGRPPSRPAAAGTQEGDDARPSSPAPAPPIVHPISTLIKAAEEDYNALLKKETHDVRAAAVAYRTRRGRHPPPGFETWYNFAQKKSAVMVEDFFDQIYHDTAPFWGIDPHQLRREGKNFDITINIRNGNTSTTNEWFWTRIWVDLIKTIEEFLPDMDLAVNTMDEPRLLVPWEKINEYMADERKTRHMPPPNEVVAQYSGLVEFDKEEAHMLNDQWDRSLPYFPKARVACHPDEPARTADIMDDWTRDPRVSMNYARPHTYRGYVSNWTLATSYCHQPDLQALHGVFIEPTSIRNSEHLMPMFGGSKLATNNEILLPAPMYWQDDERFSGGADHGKGTPWEKKTDAVMWRGAATGGRNKKENWQGFQRPRFVAMMNATQVSMAENWTAIPRNFELPPKFYDLKGSRRGHVGDWLKDISDVSLVDLVCFPFEEGGDCTYLNPYFSRAESMSMGQQFHWKYLPDVDGNSFSGRYRGFLMSNSLPIKATIFREWHDSRIVPWKHFIPMDNRFQDFWGIMEYFLGYKGFDEEDHVNRVDGHDAAAKKIALDGQEWASKVLRQEDMQIYVFRLLLEYARVCDDNRNKMGWVADIVESQHKDNTDDGDDAQNGPPSKQQQQAPKGDPAAQQKGAPKRPSRPKVDKQPPAEQKDTQGQDQPAPAAADRGKKVDAPTRP